LHIIPPCRLILDFGAAPAAQARYSAVAVLH
jgi:hypothetical protein